MFIRLTYTNGPIELACLVNTDAIQCAYVDASDVNSHILVAFEGGQAIHVTESIQEIKDAITQQETREAGPKA